MNPLKHFGVYTEFIRGDTKSYNNGYVPTHRYECVECDFKTKSTREAQAHSDKYKYGHNIITRKGETIR